MEKTVLLEVAEGVATVTLNRVDAGNALNMQMGRELLDAALACEFDPKVRAVVLTGAGKHFGFGGDIRGMAEQGDAVGGFLNELTTHIHAAISSFTRMRAPVVAAVNGTAAGGAVGLVCTADLAIAGRGSKFSLAYTGIGMAPDCGTSFLLPRIVGRRRALELFLTNRVLTADEALDWGLVNQVVEDAEVLAQSHSLAARLAAGPTDSYGAVKRLMVTSDPGFEAQMAAEGRAIAAQSLHPNGKEGVRAFLEKRKPKY
jgi:2-(1,2-epoxy-1,2-dihydrophenyl)acetyl-CoA isomerase